MSHQITEVGKLKAALENAIKAMKKSVAMGCTDHLDCAEDGGAFWYDAIEDGQQLLNELDSE